MTRQERIETLVRRMLGPGGDEGTGSDTPLRKLTHYYGNGDVAECGPSHRPSAVAENAWRVAAFK